MRTMQQTNSFTRPAPFDDGGDGRTTIIRFAKLVGDSGEFPCVLREVGEDRLRVRLFGPVPMRVSPMTLAFGDGETVTVMLIWQRGTEAGFRLCEQADRQRLLCPQGPYEKRAIRVAVSVVSQVQALSGTQDVTIRNLSHEGACIECAAHFAIDQRLKLAIPELGDVVATVRWRKDREYGLAFVETFHFEAMARAVRVMQQQAGGDAGEIYARDA